MKTRKGFRNADSILIKESRLSRLLCIFTLLFVATNAVAADLTVDVGNITSNRGNIVVTIYATEEDFLEDGLVTMIQPASPGRMALVFEGLTPGDYTASAHHDEDGDGEMDYFFGLPQEPYGFSNDARVMLAPPKYEDAVFAVGADGATVVANLVD
jgi:uncharacterized protein (DUF2141 family)